MTPLTTAHDPVLVEEALALLRDLDPGELRGALQILKNVRDQRGIRPDRGDERFRQASEQLLLLLGALDADEVEVLVRTLRAVTDRGGTLDAVSIVQEPLKARLEHLANFEEISAGAAPAVIKEYPDRERVALPRDILPLPYTIDRVIEARASRRDFAYRPIALRTLSTLLHYSYGIRTHFPAYNSRSWPLRYAPSSGALQATELYAVVNLVEGVPKGLYHYNPVPHALELLDEGNMRFKITRACLFQEWLQHAAVVLILTSVMERVEWKYGTRGYRYVHIDAGLVTSHLYLVSTALRLRACAVAAYLDDVVNDLLQVDGRNEFVSLLVAIGPRPDGEGRHDNGEQDMAESASAAR